MGIKICNKAKQYNYKTFQYQYKKHNTTWNKGQESHKKMLKKKMEPFKLIRTMPKINIYDHEVV